MSISNPSGISSRRFRVVLFLALFLLTQWPFAHWASKVDLPAWGIPFLALYLSVVYVALIGVLISAAMQAL